MEDESIGQPVDDRVEDISAGFAAPRAGSADHDPPPLRIVLGGAEADLMDLGSAVETIMRRARGGGTHPLAVASANLDHVHHFGDKGRWHGVIEQSELRGELDWLVLLDGAPLVAAAERVTARSWPRLAGSDLIDPLLDAAESAGVTVGFLGGAAATHEQLSRQIRQGRPALRVSGWWAPPRQVLADPDLSAELAEQVRLSGTDILVVGMGKPRQELWIAEYGPATGTRVLLAFGAVVDFLAGHMPRAPRWASNHGLEWSYRLYLEPRRLAPRYLVDGPVAYRRLQRLSTVSPAPARSLEAVHSAEPAAAGQEPDITVLVVTRNDGFVVEDLVSSIARSANGLSVRVVVRDDGSTDLTREWLSDDARVEVVTHPNDFGPPGRVPPFALAWRSRALLLTDPETRFDGDGLKRLWDRLWQPGVGAVVPRVVGAAGAVQHTLRFEPTALRRLGDAVIGDHLGSRPTWSTTIDMSEEAYQHPHPIEGSSSGCLLVRSEAAAAVGAWGDRLSLRTVQEDVQRRVRSAGWTVWYEPRSIVTRVTLGFHRPAALAGALSGSVVVPAHNEGSVIARTLEPLADRAATGGEVLVAANGCTDDTAAVASKTEGVAVLEIPAPSKSAALNAADARATAWPRLYLDADVEVSERAVTDTFAVLESGAALAARPVFRYETTGASSLVRAFFRARMRVPETSRHLWGGGAYALSEAGRARFGQFPDLVADDVFIDSLFAPDEKRIVLTDPVVVRTPTRLMSLLWTLRRNYRGNRELAAAAIPDAHTPVTTPTVARQLVLSVRSFDELFDAAVYTALVVAARLLARTRGPRWERDESSR